MTKSVEERFWQKVDKSAGPDGCWLWLAFRHPSGYGSFQHRGSVTTAHRVAWELIRGPILKGVKVLHHCETLACVNPTHLFLSGSLKATVERFWSKVDKSAGPNGCWLWIASCDPDGYGRFYHLGGLRRAPRVSWALTNGSIPKGLCVLHHCDNPPCVNPTHLFLGTNADNTRDAARKGRMHPGESNGSHKLTKEEVLEIREEYAYGDMTQRELADAYGVSQPQISVIVNRKRWKHLL